MIKRLIVGAVAFLATVSMAFGMDAASVPPKFPIPWGNSAGPSYIRAIPEASQIGIQNCAASLTDGFPPLSFTPVGAGGCAPLGQDFNGILKQVTQWSQWQAAGAPLVYDNAFSAAIGGYPMGTILEDAALDGGFWFNTVDNNTTDPDTGGAGWVAFYPTGAGSAATIDITTSGAFTISAANQVIGLNRTVSPAASSSTLPTGVQNGKTIEIQDLASNFNLYPVTISAPAGSSISGNASVLLNVDGQDAKFTYHASTNTWACNCLNVSVPVGTLKIVAHTTADTGYLLADGSCVSETTYATLYGVIGSTYSSQNGCTGSTFGLPDMRGRVAAGSDNFQTSKGAAGRLPSNIVGTAIGAAGGIAEYSSGIATTYLQSFTTNGSMSGSMSGSVTGNVQDNGGNLLGTVGNAGFAQLQGQSGGGPKLLTDTDASIVNGSASVSGSVSGNTTCVGCNSAAFPTFPNTQIVYYEIKY